MVEIVVLNPDQVERHLDDLAEVLADCVAGGAGVNFLLPFPVSAALLWWRGVLPAVRAGERIVLAAIEDGRVLGTVQLMPAPQPNQPHRADISKMLVHSNARCRGLGEALMRAAEAEARKGGRTLLTLDTVSDSAAERLYARLGWQVAGRIPGYALSPHGRSDDATFMWKAL